jgi:predicted DNA-binding protein with PD1-like motif
MRSAVDGSVVMVRMDDGEDMFESLRKAAWAQGVSSGYVVFGIGQLKDFELGYFDGRQYHRKTFPEAHELVGLHGTITLSADPPMHVHAAVSGRDFVLKGGHVFKATVATVGEVCIQKLSRIQMTRELDSRDGLMKLALG